MLPTWRACLASLCRAVAAAAAWRREVGEEEGVGVIVLLLLGLLLCVMFVSRARAAAAGENVFRIQREEDERVLVCGSRISTVVPPRPGRAWVSKGGARSL